MLKFRLVPLCVLLFVSSACVDKGKSIKVLTVGAAQFSGNADHIIRTDCLAWRLAKDEVRTVLSHAKPIASGYERNLYAHLPCNIVGKAVIEGAEVRYTLNAAGLISLDSDGKFENFDWIGCADPACFSFFPYQRRGLD